MSANRRSVDRMQEGDHFPTKRYGDFHGIPRWIDELSVDL